VLVPSEDRALCKDAGVMATSAQQHCDAVPASSTLAALRFINLYIQSFNFNSSLSLFIVSGTSKLHNPALTEPGDLITHIRPPHCCLPFT
jgi:hypothetical protein